MTEKTFGINFTATKTKSCFSLHYSGNGSNLHVNKTDICKFKGLDKISAYQYCIGCGFTDFTKEMNEFLINGVVYNFPTDYGLIDKENIINIHEYIMRKHNT